MLAGFFVCVGWRLAGEPFGLGFGGPRYHCRGIALVSVSLATYKKTPSVFLEVKKQT